MRLSRHALRVVKMRSSTFTTVTTILALNPQMNFKSVQLQAHWRLMTTKSSYSSGLQRTTELRLTIPTAFTRSLISKAHRVRSSGSVCPQAESTWRLVLQAMQAVEELDTFTTFWRMMFNSSKLSL